MSGIKIKPTHKGLLHKDTGTPSGDKISTKKEEKLKSSGSPAEKKRATFALNAKKWNKS
jgi:hypothetical protein